MLRGIYSAASGMTMNMQVVDVLAHNLANANTSGYKRRQPVMQAFGDLVVELARGNSYGNTGTGVRLAEIARNEQTGPMRRTGNPLDLALGAQGQYLVIQRRDGARLFTRDGQLYRNEQNALVTASGDAVLGTDLNPLTLKEDLRNIKIQEDGTILGSEGEIGRLLVAAPNPSQLIEFPRAQGPVEPAERAVIRQGFLESSNVNIISEMVSLVEANRAFGFAQKIVSAHDQMLQKAANDLGRIQ